MRQPRSSTVAVVIPCFDQMRFLANAIDSAMRQTVSPSEIIVVDDGSNEDVSTVTCRYPHVRLIRQENRGLAGARNSGLKAATSDRIIFLDADDVLDGKAVEFGLDCFRANSDAAFVYGAHRQVRGTTSSTTYWPVGTHRDLVRCNWVGMIGTVMFERSTLLRHGGFDESLGMCEDWDAYLRLSRHLPFGCHANVVADYVKHDSNASNDTHLLWKWIEVVRANEWNRGLDPDGQQAWREGVEIWQALLGPDPAPQTMIERAGRKVTRVLLRPFRT